MDGPRTTLQDGDEHEEETPPPNQLALATQPTCAWEEEDKLMKEFYEDSAPSNGTNSILCSSDQNVFQTVRTERYLNDDNMLMIFFFG